MAASTGAATYRWRILVVSAATSLAALICASAPAQTPQRSLGLDISAWQGNISQTTWNNIRNVENREFVFLRSSRGGTTGFYNQSNAGNNNPPGQNTLSQRYDDPYFVQNIFRATNAGMFAGAYHFSRPDIVAGTLNSNGIPNNGTDEANHFIQMAGPWMRPGYLLPVHDLEAGQAERTSAELSQFGVDFSNRILSVTGIRPIVYSSQNYANYVNSTVPAVYPDLWIARWPQGSGNQFTGNVQTMNPPPSPSTANVYGKWNPNHTVANPYPDGHPWKFWQYSSGERLQSFNNGGSNLDGDVAHGDAEFLKDHLVPAIWMNNLSGEWTQFDGNTAGANYKGSYPNWNSGQKPIKPVPGAGQVAPVGDIDAMLPVMRLPTANDTVILERPAANITVTLSSGAHSIRKLFMRETLNITGGSLSIGYVPPTSVPSNFAPMGTISAQFSGPVSLSGNAALSVHTLQVDATRTFTVSNSSLTFNTIGLMPHASNPAKIALNGNVNINPLNNATATIANGSGSGSTGLVNLNGGNRILNVGNGSAAVDAAISVPITNGGLIKRGVGTLALGGINSYTGNTVVDAGRLSLGTASLADTSAIYLAAGTTLDLAFSGNDIINSLWFNGMPQIQGTWGALGSGAQFTSSLFTGAGRLQVATKPPTPPPPPPPATANILDNFESNEGHFDWAYNTSPSPQTKGLISGPRGANFPTDRVTTEQHGGVGSQLIDLVIDNDADHTWQLRHNSGIGAVATPAGNVPLSATGYVGFWLKTDDPNVQVQIAIDDPVPAGSAAIELGSWLPVAADNQWRLYQWNFQDAAQWDVFDNPGSDGDIDATNGFVTIDSIWFKGSGNTQIYLDDVSHNPGGVITGPPVAGDYNDDGAVDVVDYNMWRQYYSMPDHPGVGADGTGDGVVNMLDYVFWRKSDSAFGTGSITSAVPEPQSLLLLVAGVATMLLRPVRPEHKNGDVATGF